MTNLGRMQAAARALEDLLEHLTPTQVAVAAKLLAIQNAQYRHLHGEIPTPEIMGFLTGSVSEDDAVLIADGLEKLAELLSKLA